jgi:hypothetical protein
MTVLCRGRYIHSTHLKEHALPNICKTKEYVLANGAPRHDAGTLHVQMCLSKAPYCAAVRALHLCSRNIHGEYLAQFTRGSVTLGRLAGRQRELVMTASRQVHVLRVASPAIRHRARRPGKHKFHTLGCESVQSLVPLASLVLFAVLLEPLSHRLLGSFSSPIQSAILTSRIF